MRFTLLLAVLLVTVALTAAGKKNGKNKKMKSLKWFHKKCENGTVSYSPCSMGKMTKTLSSPSNNVRCNKEDVIDCVVEVTGGRGGCSKVFTYDYTPCGEGEAMYTFNMTSTGCAKGDKSISKQFRCDGKPKKHTEKAAKKQLWKAYILKKREMKAKGCFYEKTFDCDTTGTFSVRPLDERRSKDVADCDPNLKAPCMQKKRKGGKRKNKKNKKRKNGGKKGKN